MLTSPRNWGPEKGLLPLASGAIRQARVRTERGGGGSGVEWSGGALS
jgi:hypothetical protein